MKHIFSFMLLFAQGAIASEDSTSSGPHQTYQKIKQLQQDQAKLQKKYDELLQMVNEIKLVKVTCICEIDTLDRRYITGEGITTYEAEKQAMEVCRTKYKPSHPISIFNCLDERLDRVRHHFYPSRPEEPDPRRPVRKEPSGY
ncbi:MAG: hypothetical protein OXJ52_04725 [Oligoflexia bacterium]|nr:hypothetical protein [Oligoflexia bacterium]